MKSTRLLSLLFVGAISWSLAVPGALAASVLHVPRDFASIQAAVDAAEPGDIVQVARDTYSENVVVTTPNIRLHGQNATLDGSGLGGAGIHVLGTDGARIWGFVVENFEVGIVLEGTRESHVHNNELRGNMSETSTLRDGIQLIDAHYNSITNNFAHDNGHNGITLKEGSTNNSLRGNVSNDNGLQVMVNFGGCGIQLIAGDNNDNVIAQNTTRRNGWGIQVGPDSNNNTVVQNRSHGNARAGIVVLDPEGPEPPPAGVDNFIAQNNAKDNGVADVPPSGLFDLFDQGDLDNIWERNQGTFNF